MTLPESTQKKLETARELLRHQVPNGDLPAVLDHVLDAFIKTRMKRKFATTTRPRQKAKSNNEKQRSRHIPNAIKRAVLERDGVQCSFVDANGHRRTATSQLEFHHHVAFAKDGKHSVENVSLVCRAHNGHAARRDFGPVMERYQKPPVNDAKSLILRERNARKAFGEAYRKTEPIENGNFNRVAADNAF